MTEPYEQLGANLTPQQKLFFHQEYAKQNRSPSTALVLALLLGGFGAHRFYLRQWGWGIAYVLFSWTFVPIVASLVECFLIRKRTENYNKEVARQIIQKMKIIFSEPGAGSAPGGVESLPHDGSRLAPDFRDERECPYCAEKILKKARVCKHCGRDVEPLVKADTSAQVPPPATPEPTKADGGILAAARRVAEHGAGEDETGREIIYCGGCGTRNPGGERFCSSCLLEAARRLSEYTEEGKGMIRAELCRRGLDEPPPAHEQESKPAAAASRPLVIARAPQFRMISEAPGKMKFVAVAGAALILVVAGVWYLSQQGALRFLPGRSRPFPVLENFKCGYIDKTGKYVIKPQFDEAGSFAEGVALVYSGQKWGYIDTTGKYVIKPEFDYGWAFSEGLAQVNLGGKTGFIDRTGRTVIAPQQFERSGDFSEGLAGVKVAGKWGFIDKTGKYVIERQFESVGDFHTGLAVAEKGGKSGYIGRDGHFVIPPQFDWAWEFSSNGLAPVRVGEKWGYINRAGNFVAAPQFTNARPFADGFARVLVGNKCGYVDGSAKLVLKPEYENCLAFSEGLAPVMKDGRWGYIDKTGAFAIEPHFSRAEKFSLGMAYVDYGTSVISANGTTVWSASPTSFEGTFNRYVQPLLQPYYDHLSDENHLDGKWGVCSGGTLQTKNSACFVVSSGKPEEIAGAIYHDATIATKLASLGFDGLLFEKHEADAEAHTFHVLFGMKPTPNGWEHFLALGLPSFLETPDYYYQRGVDLQSSGDMGDAKTWFEAVVAKFPTSNLVGSAQERLVAVAKAEADRAAEMQRQQEERERLADEPTPAELDCVCRDIRNSGARCDDPHDAYDVARVAKHAARVTGLPLCSER
ncbi:MAG: WG repeat-containing protein [Terriglobia bacterium]|jgi:TM2 domain-containing membrane protein YozV